MPATHLARPAPFGSESLQRLVAAVDGLFGRVSRRFGAADTRDALLRLTPRQRDDIGLGDAPVPSLDLDEIARSLSAGRR